MASVKPKLSMRPISTPVNLLVCGASGSGKSSFISAFIKMLGSADSAESPGLGREANGPLKSWKVSGTGPSADPHAVLLAGPDEFAAAVGPIPVPEAGRELLYRLQDCPGYGATLDPADYLEALLTFLFKQQAKDFNQLHGSRGMPKSLVCGSLAHSISACLYFLPPAGPSKLDLVLMAGLSRRVALLPVVGRADNMTPAEAEHCCKLVQHMLAAPEEYVAGINGSIEPYKPSSGSASYLELPFLMDTRSSTCAGAHEAANDGFNRLAQLFTGDEVYALLDHAWDMYNDYCDNHEYGYYDAYDGSTPASLVSAICADVKLPSFKALVDAKEQLLEEENNHSSTEGKLRSLQSRLNDTVSSAAEELDHVRAQLKAAEAAKASEAQMVDDLWKVFMAFRTKIGYNNYAVSQHVNNKEIPAALKQRLPGLN